LGASQRLLDICIEHIRSKIQSEHPKETLQAAQFKLADMAAEIYAARIYAARQMLYHAAESRDQGEKITQEASMVKLFCTEMAGRIADTAMDIFENEGYL